MPRAAVLGAPIDHSLSPALHRAAYLELGLAGWSYGPIHCELEDLERVLDNVRAEDDWAGLSLTMPLKTAVLPMLDGLDERAVSVGAVNTVIRRADGRLDGFNTDIAGARFALASLDIAALPVEVVVIGGGGSARAVVAALSEGGVARVRVVMRDPSRGTLLRAIGDTLGVQVTLHRWSSLADEVAGAALVVSTVPAGSRLDLGPWPQRAALFDLTYDPWPTPLVSLASSVGAPTVGGMEMLAAQAALQVEYMTGHPIAVEVLMAAGAAALAARAPE